MNIRYDRSKKISSGLISDMKYMYVDTVIGLLGTLVLNYRLSLSQDTIDGMKDALIDEFFYGLDPDWKDYGTYRWFEEVNPDWFEIRNADFYCNKFPKDFN